MMKKTINMILTVMGVLVLVACSSLTPAEKAERRAKRAQAVEQALAARHYRVSVNMMYPRRGKARTVSSDYGLEVKGDTLVSYLPYFGRAYNVPYGGGKGLNFTETLTEYYSKKLSNGATQVLIKVKNEEDVYNFTLEIFDNGSTSIDLNSRERESINYSGNMELPDD